MPESSTRICTKCQKTLVSFGHARKNGQSHKDWSSRTLHKKCWKEQQLELQWKLNADLHCPVMNSQAVPVAQ